MGFTHYRVKGYQPADTFINHHRQSDPNSVQDTLPDPQGGHIRGVPLYFYLEHYMVRLYVWQESHH